MGTETSVGAVPAAAWPLAIFKKQKNNYKVARGGGRTPLRAENNIRSGTKGCGARGEDLRRGRPLGKARWVSPVLGDDGAPWLAHPVLRSQANDFNKKFNSIGINCALIMD